MTDAKELREHANILRTMKPVKYDDWRNLCLGAADVLVRQASFNEAIIKEKAELIYQLDNYKKTITDLSNNKLSLESENERLTQELTVAKHWLDVERRKNKKQG